MDTRNKMTCNCNCHYGINENRCNNCHCKTKKICSSCNQVIINKNLINENKKLKRKLKIYKRELEIRTHERDGFITMKNHYGKQIENIDKILTQIKKLSNRYAKLDSSGKPHSLETYHFNNELKNIIDKI